MKISKKGQGFSLGAMGALAVLLVVGFMTAAIVARVVQQAGDRLGADNTTSENLTEQGETALMAYADFASIIGLVIVASVVLGVVRQFL